MSSNIVIRGLKKIKRLIINPSGKFRFVDPTAYLAPGVNVYANDNLIMEENTNIDPGGIIMNTRAKFIMKKNSGAAIGLLVVTGNHMSQIGKFFKQIGDEFKDKAANPKQYDKDIIVEEEVWIGARVTLLYGTHIKRGAVIGAGSVVRTSVPPYAVVMGNPAKIVGFRFTPEEILEHEKALYSPNERLSFDEVDKYYKKYYTNRISKINNFIKL